MPTRHVDLTEHYETFLAECLDTGRYHTASEAVQAALHLLERPEQEEDAKLAWLRSATREAFESLDRGEGILLTSDQDLDESVDEAVRDSRSAGASTHG